MNPRLLRVIVLGVILVGGLITWGFSRQNAGPSDKDIDHFQALMEQGAQADLYEVRKAFRKCFKKGKPISRYEKILSKAQKKKPPYAKEGSFIYEWGSASGDGFLFQVYVEGDPPVITHAGFAEYDF